MRKGRGRSCGIGPTRPSIVVRKSSPVQPRRAPNWPAQRCAHVVSEPQHGTRGAKRSARLCRSAGGPTGMAGENGLSATVGATANAVRWVGAPVSPAICIVSADGGAGPAHLRVGRLSGAPAQRV